MLRTSVSRDEAIKFCENALRNVNIDRLTTEDLDDIAGALAWFIKDRSSPYDDLVTAMRERDKVFAAYILDPEAASPAHLHDHYRRGIEGVMCPPTNHNAAWSAWKAGNVRAMLAASKTPSTNPADRGEGL